MTAQEFRNFWITNEFELMPDPDNPHKAICKGQLFDRMLAELIEHYCREQREIILRSCKFSSDGDYYFASKDEILNAKQPEL